MNVFPWFGQVLGSTTLISSLRRVRRQLTLRVPGLAILTPTSDRATALP